MYNNRQIPYPAFGSAITNMQYVNDTNRSYRYRFNGMEKENEANSEVDNYDFGARIYHSRIGRWLSLDPLMRKYPALSAFIYCGDNPLFFKDYDGRDVIPSTGWSGTQFETILKTLKEANNSVVLKLYEVYASKDNNVELQTESVKDQRGGQTPIDPNTGLVKIIMNLTYDRLLGKEIDDRGNKVDIFASTYYGIDSYSELLSKQKGIKIHFRYTQSEIGKTFALIHELTHAIAHSNKLKDKEHHIQMATNENLYRTLLENSLTEANETYHWALNSSQIKALSYSGLTNTIGFTNYLSERAGLKSGWEKDENSSDPTLKAAYVENKKLYDTEYHKWESEIKELILDKQYVDNSGNIIMTKESDRK